MVTPSTGWPIPTEEPNVCGFRAFGQKSQSTGATVWAMAMGVLHNDDGDDDTDAHA